MGSSGFSDGLVVVSLLLFENFIMDLKFRFSPSAFCFPAVSFLFIYMFIFHGGFCLEEIFFCLAGAMESSVDLSLLLKVITSSSTEKE